MTVADPAVGTGTFLLGILRRIAGSVRADQGAGAVPAAVAAATSRIVGFELQFGPFAVAQLRLIAEMQALMKTETNLTPPIPELQLFIADTLGNPYIEEEKLGQIYEPVAKSRRMANRIKREKPITVVIGNPPYKNQAGGLGGWIEASDSGRPSALSFWSPPSGWGLGTQAHHLKNLYVYFWRWATLKVFGSDWHLVTGEPNTDRHGIICFITAAGFLHGPGFQKMRNDLRRDASDIWIIECSPEGHQPDVPTRIFAGVQHPICIVMAARAPGKTRDQPARLHLAALPKGRTSEKLAALADLAIVSLRWQSAEKGWREPFLPEQAAEWGSLPKLAEIMDWASPGVKTHRTWVIAPDADSLERRWITLQGERDATRKSVLFHEDEDRDLRKIITIPLGKLSLRLQNVANDKGPTIPPVRYALRSFDRQWLIPDHRLINRARKLLWNEWSSMQAYITVVEDQVVTSGPAVTLTSSLPDMHHFNGRGGRAYPLWRDAAAAKSNIRSTLLAILADTYGHDVANEDVFAYIAALLAHPALTARFRENLIQPGLRVPLTANAAVFARAVAVGREVVWLHCYGERFADPSAGQPKAAPRLPTGERPNIPGDGAIPGAPEPLPDVMSYDAGENELRIGAGRIRNVTPAMWAYEVSGKNVLRQWFGYRKLDRTKPIIGDRRPPSPLDKIQPEHWPAEYTSDLLDLLNVLGRLIKLEPTQADLLNEICAGKLITAQSLRDAGAIPPRPGDEDA